MNRWLGLVIAFLFALALFGGCAFNYKSNGCSMKVNAGENPGEAQPVTGEPAPVIVEDVKPE